MLYLVELYMSANSKNTYSTDLLSWLLLFVLSLIWGSSFILIKKSLLAFSPGQVGAGRVAIAFIAYVPLFIYFFRQIDWRKLGPMFIVGLCGSGLPAYLYAKAQTEVPSAIAGLLNGLTPIFTFILAVLLFGRKLESRHLFGILLGFIGTSLIFLSKHDGQSSFPILFGMMIMLATFFYAISANTVSTYLREVNPIVISTMSFILIGPWMIIYLANTDFFSIISKHEDGLLSLSALTILSLVGTFSANILFFKLIQMTDSVFASSVSFLTPVVALLWGLWDGETFSYTFFFALMLIFYSVFLIKARSTQSKGDK